MEAGGTVWLAGVLDPEQALAIAPMMNSSAMANANRHPRMAAVSSAALELSPLQFPSAV